MAFHLDPTYLGHVWKLIHPEDQHKECFTWKLMMKAILGHDVSSTKTRGTILYECFHEFVLPTGKYLMYTTCYLRSSDPNCLFRFSRRYQDHPHGPNVATSTSPKAEISAENGGKKVGEDFLTREVDKNHETSIQKRKNTYLVKSARKTELLMVNPSQKKYPLSIRKYFL